MSLLVDQAKREFQHAGWCDENGNFECEHQEMICRGILDILDVFGKQDHSGTTAAYTMSLLNRLMNYQPITPLTGKDSEWMEVSDGLYQNVRCSTIFKENGETYNIDGKVFYTLERDKNGDVFQSCYTNFESRTPVTFPYTVTKPEYVFVPTEKFPVDVMTAQ